MVLGPGGSLSCPGGRGLAFNGMIAGDSRQIVEPMGGRLSSETPARKHVFTVGLQSQRRETLAVAAGEAAVAEAEGLQDTLHREFVIVPQTWVIRPGR